MLGNNTLDSLNKTTDEATLICHRLNQSKEHIDLKLDVKIWKQLPRVDKNGNNSNPTSPKQSMTTRVI